MLAQGSLSPLDTVIAKIQARVGTFLIAKDQIITLTNHPSDDIKSKAMILFGNQKYLEDELPNVLSKLQDMTSSTWELSDVANAGLFYNAMDSQISDVNKLQDQADKFIKPPTTLPDWLTPAIMIAIPGAIFAITMLTREKK